VAATVFTMIGYVLGSLSWVIMDRAQATGTSPIDVLARNSLPALAGQAVFGGFSIYLLYWFVAIIAAVFLSRRALSRPDRLAIGLYESRRRDA
jgi:hypothetical protein